MEPKSGSAGMFLAPGASVTSYSFPAADKRPTPQPFPRNEGSDFATDVSVRKKGINPETGERYLEELSFEIVNEQTKKAIENKAQDLVRRGVRRVFAIFVKTGQTSEWSRVERCFVPMAKDAVFDDPVLVRPMVVRALADRTLAQFELIRTLEKAKHPEIERIRQEGHKKGVDEGDVQGRRAMLCELLEDQFGALPASVLLRIESGDIEQIRAWTKKMRNATSLDDVFTLQS